MRLHRRQFLPFAGATVAAPLLSPFAQMLTPAKAQVAGTRAFNTPKFNAAVTRFKADFGGHPQLFEYGQFYLTDRQQDDILAVIRSELEGSLALQLLGEPARTEAIDKAMKLFAHQFSEGASGVSVPKINAIIDLLVPATGELSAVRALFAPGPDETKQVQADFKTVWTPDTIGSAPPFLGGTPSLRRMRAAYQLEKDKCFACTRALARKLFKKRGITSIPPKFKIGESQTAGATLVGPPPGTGPVVPLQTIHYSSAAAIKTTAARMRAALDAGALVQCGVLSGASHDRSTFPKPEHFVLVFDHDVVDGKDAFIFWDSDTGVSNIQPAPGGPALWGPGFGCLISADARLSTAFDAGDLTNIDATRNSINFGQHMTQPRRKRYQVYQIQTLPL